MKQIISYQPRIRLVSDSFIIKFHDPSTAAVAVSSIIISGGRRRTSLRPWCIARLIGTARRWHVHATNSIWTQLLRRRNTGKPTTRPMLDICGVSTDTPRSRVAAGYCYKSSQVYAATAETARPLSSGGSTACAKQSHRPPGSANWYRHLMLTVCG